MQTEWICNYAHDFCIRCHHFLPFPQTQAEVCCNFEYFVALNNQ